MMSYGIDYGMGSTNIDRTTGIRYGVISANGDVCQAWAESSEADYGAPSCPRCGNEIVDYDDDKHEDYASSHTFHEGSRDYACEACELFLGSDDVCGEEPRAFIYSADGYECSQSGDDSDIFITKSPYYTHAQFCSPCAPGACHLDNPVDKRGPRAYCLGHDWFNGGRAPYHVYLVATGKRVPAPKRS